MGRVWEGGCHCGAVRFRVDASEVTELLDCNCSMCAMKGFLHLIVPGERFTLLSGAEALSTYTFNTKQAKHHFCSTCGITSFYVPRSHPDGFSVNARCLDRGIPAALPVVPFDGQRWEESVDAIAGYDP
ncbi:MAG: aldehyde-activating protein [Myxococcales bacterium]|nr:aldehyde-activating protein [Myxococcales bacterium]